VVRKRAPSGGREVGSCSRAPRSLSSWSRFSWLSTRNSAMISSRSSNDPPPVVPIGPLASGLAERTGQVVRRRADDPGAAGLLGLVHRRVGGPDQSPGVVGQAGGASDADRHPDRAAVGEAAGLVGADPPPAFGRLG